MTGVIVIFKSVELFTMLFKNLLQMMGSINEGVRK